LPAPLCGAGKNRQKKRNGSPRHRLADSAETPKEKRPFLFQKEFPRAQIRKARSVFFRGSALNRAGGGASFNCVALAKMLI